MSDDVTSNREYEVGYKKPPKTGQFKKGQSGNSKGSSDVVRARKSGKRSFGDLFSKGMQSPVTIEENGKPRVIARMHLAIRKYVEDAAKGNMKALKALLKLRDVKEAGPLAPAKRLVLALDEARAAGPPGDVLYRPNTVLIHQPKPTAPGEAPKRKSGKAEPQFPRRSVGELIEIELEREIRVTDATSGTNRRMTMREVIAEQLMRLFTAGKPGSVDLIIKLNQRAVVDSDELKKIYIYIPHGYEMPPKLPPNWRDNRPAERSRPLVTEAPPSEN